MIRGRNDTPKTSKFTITVAGEIVAITMVRIGSRLEMRITDCPLAQRSAVKQMVAKSSPDTRVVFC